MSPILNIHNVNVTESANKNSLFILITFENVNSKIVETTGLVDSGAGGKFIDQNYA